MSQENNLNSTEENNNENKVSVISPIQNLDLSSLNFEGIEELEEDILLDERFLRLSIKGETKRVLYVGLGEKTFYNETTNKPEMKETVYFIDSNKDVFYHTSTQMIRQLKNASINTFVQITNVGKKAKANIYEVRNLKLPTKKSK